MEDKVVILWKDKRGILTQTPPGIVVAAGMNAQAVKSLGEKNRVFLLTLSDDEEKIIVERITPKPTKKRAKKSTSNGI